MLSQEITPQLVNDYVANNHELIQYRKTDGLRNLLMIITIIMAIATTYFILKSNLSYEPIE